MEAAEFGDSLAFPQSSQAAVTSKLEELPLPPQQQMTAAERLPQPQQLLQQFNNQQQLQLSMSMGDDMVQPLSAGFMQPEDSQQPQQFKLGKIGNKFPGKKCIANLALTRNNSYIYKRNVLSKIKYFLWAHNRALLTEFLSDSKTAKLFLFCTLSQK